jgi:glyoxylase-like metal-dependent hydrolase (beta-lactamase superfamily II)
VLEAGETISAAGRQFAVEYTPGHASHHAIYLDRSDGTAYVGDVAGVRIPPSSFVRPPTPPPDIDIEQWKRSIDRVAAMEPAALALTHFGAVEEPGPHLEQTKLRLDQHAELARLMLEEHGDTERAAEEFRHEVNRLTAAESDQETVAVFDVGASVGQSWLGLRRYWQKQAEQRPREQTRAARN